MKYIKYNDAKISKLSLGTVQFGLNYGIANSKGQPNQNDVNDILDYVTSNGINSFDTAQGYGDSEEVIGKYFKTANGQNNLIVSKIDSKELLLSETVFESTIKNSISKLNVDKLFGLLMHNSNLMEKWTDEYSNKVNMLKEKQNIKYFGVSIYTNHEFEMAIHNKDINIIQIPFNIFDQRAMANEWFKKAKENNKLIFIRSIYLQGLLLMDSNNIPEKLIAAKVYIEKLDDIANQLKMTKNELCLSFVNTIAENASLLFGCETMSQAQENIDIFNNMKNLDESTISTMIYSFKNISENIYNPTKW